MNRLKRPDPQLWLLLAASVVVWGPLLNPAYFFRAHDAPHSIFYLVEFDQTLRDGYLWPRWSPDFAFGYGYPLFNIYAPLAIYMAEVVHLLGAGMVAAVKTVYIGATVGAGLAMYGFARRLFGPNAGLLAAVVYMLAPFHLTELYVRSAFAEYVSLMWLPLILWAFTELAARPSWRRLSLAGASYGLLALTHHTTFFTFTPFLALYILALAAGRAGWDLRRWLTLATANLGAGLLGLMLAAVYLLPAILEQSFIKVEQWTAGSYTFEQHFVYLSQLLSPFWGYGYAGPGPNDGMPFQVGMVVYGLLAVGLVGLAAFGRPESHRGAMVIFLAATGISLWLMSPPAAGVWRALPVAALVQFPWRLLIITTLSAAVVAGSAAHLLGLNRESLGLVLLAVALGSFNYAQPEYTPIPEWAATSLAVINWDAASPADRVGMVTYTQQQPATGPMEAQYRAGEPLQVAGVIAGEAVVRTVRHGGASDVVRVTGGPATVQFYTYDYPGWQVRLNGAPIPHRPAPPSGLITVEVPAGEHQLSLRMGTTPPRLAGGALSLLALAVVGASFAFKEQTTHV
ncbi:MAG: 6-pyruvoyl-tetrahydropterin synthase-related protein [Anaerolineae bacterium]